MTIVEDANAFRERDHPELNTPLHSAPLYIAWEVTRRCNANCIHCYSDSGANQKDPAELSTAEALDMIDQLAEAGLVVLAFSGGEPFVRKDIFTLIGRAVRRGLLVNIATNGSTISDDVAQRLKDSGVRSVTVSLDGPTAEVHDCIRRFPGLFDRAVSAIRSLVERDVRVGISFTPMLPNYREGRAVVHLAYDIGAEAINMSEFVPAGRGAHSLALPPETLREVLNDWIEMRREYTGRISVLWHDCRVALLVPPEERDLYSGCGAGKTMARILSDGTLTPCVFLPNPVGNFRASKFHDLWQNSPLLDAIRTRRDIVTGNCSACEHKSICGGCRATSMAYYGDPMRGDPSCWIVPEAPKRTALF
jgi:radical SAM additional 4Fe4S-binding domain